MTASRTVVLPTLDPNDIKSADISKSLRQSESLKHSLKRKRQKEYNGQRGNKIYDIPSDLKEDVVSKDNKLLHYPNEAITQGTRSKKKTKLRSIHPMKQFKLLYLLPEDWEK